MPPPVVAAPKPIIAGAAGGAVQDVPVAPPVAGVPPAVVAVPPVAAALEAPADEGIPPVAGVPPALESPPVEAPAAADVAPPSTAVAPAPDAPPTFDEPLVTSELLLQAPSKGIPASESEVTTRKARR